MTSHDKNIMPPEYQEFLSLSENEEPMKTANNKNYAKLNYLVAKELVDSKLKLALIYFAFSVLGYILNLSLCAQGPVGLTALSHLVFKHLHIGSKYTCLCAFTTGTVFTSLPLFISFLFLNPFQRRFLLSHLSCFIFLIPLIATILMFVLTLRSAPEHAPMLNLGSFSIAMMWVNGAIWAISALLMPALLILIFKIFSKQKKYIVK